MKRGPADRLARHRLLRQLRQAHLWSDSLIAGSVLGLVGGLVSVLLALSDLPFAGSLLAAATLGVLGQRDAPGRYESRQVPWSLVASSRGEEVPDGGSLVTRLEFNPQLGSKHVA